MVRILVQNANGSRLSYDVNPKDPICVLKAHIEETEGMNTDGLTFELGPTFPLDAIISLDEDRTFESYDIKENSTILLHRHLIRIFISNLSGKTVVLLVDPDYTCERFKELIRVTKGIVVDDLNTRLIFTGKVLEDALTLSSYGVTRDSTIQVVRRVRGGGLRVKQPRPKARAIVLLSWNGNMRQEEIEGLPLTRGDVVCIDQLVHLNWFRGYIERDKTKGLFPRNLVSIFRIFDDNFRTELGDESLPKASVWVSADSKPANFTPLDAVYRLLGPRKPTNPDHVETDVIQKDSDLSIPTLPAEIPDLLLPDFPYPDIRPEFFTGKLGDRGLSFVEVAVSLKPLLTPANRPHVDVLLKCCPAHPRRISSVVLSLEFPKNQVDDVEPTVVLGPETKMDIEMTDNTSKSLSGGLDREGVTASAEWKHEVEEVQSATRVTRMKINGLIKGGNTAYWSLTEDTGQGGKGGLPDQVRLSFTLNYKPLKVRYECRVTSVKGGAEKEHYFDETRRFS